MAPQEQDDGVLSRSHTDSSDDSDSQDSDDMRGKEGAGPRKTADGKVKKPVNKDPNRVKRKKARRACENCQRAHLTCSKHPLSPSLLFSSPSSIVVHSKLFLRSNRRPAAVREMRRQETMQRWKAEEGKVLGRH